MAHFIAAPGGYLNLDHAVFISQMGPVEGTDQFEWLVTMVSGENETVCASLEEMNRCLNINAAHLLDLPTPHEEMLNAICGEPDAA